MGSSEVFIEGMACTELCKVQFVHVCLLKGILGHDEQTINRMQKECLFFFLDNLTMKIIDQKIIVLEGLER